MYRDEKLRIADIKKYFFFLNIETVYNVQGGRLKKQNIVRGNPLVHANYFKTSVIIGENRGIYIQDVLKILQSTR